MTPKKAKTPEKGKRYNWKGQKERLIYVGSSGVWHQFDLISNPGTVWCKVLDEDLHMIEETKSE